MVFRMGFGLYYLFPVLLSILFYLFIIGYVFGLVSVWVSGVVAPYLPEKIPVIENASGIWSWIKNISLMGTAGFLAGLLVLVVSFKFCKYLVLMILSPVFSMMSEKMEAKLTGKVYQLTLSAFLNDLVRGLMINLRNLSLELLWTLFLWLLSFVFPLLAIVTGPLIFLAGAYYTGYSLMDYTLERKYSSVRETSAYVRKHMGLAIGIGLVYQLLDLLPVVSVVFAPVNGTVAACSAILENNQTV